jgi:hypothetical protein
MACITTMLKDINIDANESHSQLLPHLIVQASKERIRRPNASLIPAMA